MKATKQTIAVFAVCILAFGIYCGVIISIGIDEYRTIRDANKTEARIKDSLYQKANGEIIRHNLKYNCIEK